MNDLRDYDKKKIDIGRMAEELRTLNNMLVSFNAYRTQHEIIESFERGENTDIYTPESIQSKKDRILSDPLIRDNLVIANKYCDKETISDIITGNIRRLQSKTTADETKLELAKENEELNDKYKIYERECCEFFFSLAPYTVEHHASIVSMLIGGSKLDEILDAFKTFKSYIKGEISLNQATNHGLDYVESHGAIKGIFDSLLESGKRIRKHK